MKKNRFLFRAMLGYFFSSNRLLPSTLHVILLKREKQVASHQFRSALICYVELGVILEFYFGTVLWGAFPSNDLLTAQPSDLNNLPQICKN